MKLRRHLFSSIGVGICGQTDGQDPLSHASTSYTECMMKLKLW